MYKWVLGFIKSLPDRARGMKEKYEEYKERKRQEQEDQEETETVKGTLCHRTPYFVFKLILLLHSTPVFIR